jgi:glycosyltransferase involved in cell wall biosynthesis
MDASVVVPVRNGAGTLALQLEALTGQSFGGSWEVVVADNGSTDDSVAIAKSFGDRLELRIVDAADKPGAAHARNVAARRSEGSVVLFCDADDIVDVAWVQSMVEALRGADLVGGRLDALSEGAVSTSSALVGELRLHLDFLVMSPTANLGVRRSLFLELGGFDESHPGKWAEDVDFCWRAQLSGATFSYCDEAIVSYRSDVNLRAKLRRSWAYGQGDAVLLKKFAAFGVPDDPLSKISRKIGYGVKHGLQTARTPQARAIWLGQVWYLAGRLRGQTKRVQPFLVKPALSAG